MCIHTPWDNNLLLDFDTLQALEKLPSQSNRHITFSIVWHESVHYGGPNPPLYKTFAPRFYKTFAPRFYNFLHDITISSTILQFPPRFYNFLHDFTISSTILQFPPQFYKTFAPRFYKTFAPRFYNFLHDFTIFSTILQFSPRYYKIVEQIIKSWRKL